MALKPLMMRKRTEYRRTIGAVLTMLLLSACGTGGTGNSTDSGSAAVDDAGGDGTARGLDALAVESGALVDSQGTSPVGAYGRDYGQGRDRLCLLPDATDKQDGQQPARFTIGIDTSLGEDEHCQARGTARMAGNNMIVELDGGKCAIVARYEGDRIVLPGAVDTRCDRLCTGRSSLAGFSFPRIAGGAPNARKLTSLDQKPLCS